MLQSGSSRRRPRLLQLCLSRAKDRSLCLPRHLMKRRSRYSASFGFFLPEAGCCHFSSRDPKPICTPPSRTTAICVR